MPELPEVETFRRILEGKLVGSQVASYELFYPRLLLTEPSSLDRIVGERFTKIGRKGKHLIFFLTGGVVMVAHLRMEGKYFVKDEGATKEKADELFIHLDGGKKLVYNDVRKFGVLGVYDEANYLTDSPLAKVAKSPLEMDEGELFLALHKLKKPIKEGLLDQARVAGLGNIYVDETLFKAKVNPNELCCDVTEEEYSAMQEAAKATLLQAIDLGGSTIHSYHAEEGKSGNMQNQLLCYGRSPSPCPRCGFPLMKISIGGRGTTYCPICQARKHRPFVLGVTGKVHSGKSTACDYLASKGYRVIDCDKQIARLYADASFAEAAKERFPELSIDENGIDKASVWKLLGSSKKKQFLSFVYAALKERVEREIGADNGKVALEAQLLYESGFDDLCDAVLLLDAPVAELSSRLEDEGKDADKYLKLNSAFKLGIDRKKAGFVITNDSGKKELFDKLDALRLP